MKFQNSWIAWSLLSALFAAFTAILAKLGVAHVEPNLATAIRTSVVLILAWLVAMFYGDLGQLSTLDRRTVLFLILSGLATGLSWLCYFRALALGSASKVAPLDKLSVVFVIALAWPILGERLSMAKCAGALLLAGGAALIALAP